MQWIVLCKKLCKLILDLESEKPLFTKNLALKYNKLRYKDITNRHFHKRLTTMTYIHFGEQTFCQTFISAENVCLFVYENNVNNFKYAYVFVRGIKVK